jgi:hypothetical protein
VKSIGQTLVGCWPQRRFWNIACRTGHIVVTGALFGGHVFGAAPARLLPWLGLVILSGAVLILLEAYPEPGWCGEVCGLCVLGKLALLACIPWLWSCRVPLLIGVLVLAGVGSHLPRRWRHYSLLRGPVSDPP